MAELLDYMEAGHPTWFINKKMNERMDEWTHEQTVADSPTETR